MNNKNIKLKKLKEILYSGDIPSIRFLFTFNKNTEIKKILFKFKLYVTFFNADYFADKPASFHDDMVKMYIKAWFGIGRFANIGFRGSAKTTLLKVFLAFAICNDENHYRKYIKIISLDNKNATQIVTDIYNFYKNIKHQTLYPEIFEKTILKKEERKDRFNIPNYNFKIIADGILSNQRGNLQESSRPDFVIADDITNKKTVRSPLQTQTIKDYLGEAKTGLSSNGSLLMLGNYISEADIVHNVIEDLKDKEGRLLITAILDKKNNPTWKNKYNMEKIKQLKEDEKDDFYTERMCQPRLSKDVYFNRANVERQKSILPLKVISDFKIYRKYNPSHQYGSGHDIAGGVGLDSSTTVIIDFSTYPAQVVATYVDNTIKPDVFAYEIQRQVNQFGNCITAPELNNHGNGTVAILKQLGVNLFIHKKETDKRDDINVQNYGWNTSSLTKNIMLSELSTAINDGLIILNDKDLINEVKSFTRNDVVYKHVDVALITRHFDLIIALAIAWQMRKCLLPSESSLIIKQYNVQKQKTQREYLTDYGI